MSDELIRRYAKPVPRYTSYPTAPHFHTGVQNATYVDWLQDRTTIKLGLTTR